MNNTFLELRIKGKLNKLEVPLDRSGNSWCTLGNIQANDVDLAQLMCCSEPVSLRPNGFFIPCRNCGHGYMLRDGYHDKDTAGAPTHMHLFHKPEDVQLLLAYATGVQQEILKLNIGAPSGSTRGIYAIDGIDGTVEQVHIACCKTEFAVLLDKSKTCPECQTYRYSLGAKKAKTIVSWEDVARGQESGKNRNEYHNSTRRFKAGM